MSTLSTAGLAPLSLDVLGVADGLPNENELNAVDDAADALAPNEKRPVAGSFGWFHAGAASFGVSSSFTVSASAGFSSFFGSSVFFSLAGDASFSLLRLPNEKVAVGAALTAPLLPNENVEPLADAPNPWLPLKLPNENCCDDALAMPPTSLFVEAIASLA